MIDGITLSNIPIEAVTNSDILEFKPMGNREEARYNGLIIAKNESSCRLRGSIHKYFNGGKHNYNDFTLLDFVNALNDLCRTINIEPQTIRLSGFEIGVNLDVSNIDRVLDSILLYNNAEPTKRKGITRFVFADYEVKIYKKELKGYKPKLRFELALRRSRKTKSILSNYAKKHKSKEYISCNTLSDLTSSLIWQIYSQELLTIFDDIVMVDTDCLNLSELSKKNRELVTSGLAPGYWVRDWSNRMTRNRRLKRFKDIVNNSSSTLKEELREQISSKIKELINIEAKPLYSSSFNVKINNSYNISFIVPTYSKRNTQNETNVSFVEIEKKGQSVTNVSFVEVDVKGQSVTNVSIDKKDNRNTSINTTEEHTHKERRCRVTNLSLEIGIKQNEVLSTKGVKYYYQNKREIYDTVLYPRLSQRMRSKPLNKQFEAIAHSLRNERSNPRNNLKRDLKNLEQGVPMLFCFTEMLRSDKKLIYKQAIKEKPIRVGKYK